jgi:C_GCAxxG_C_C family probable redox protein
VENAKLREIMEQVHARHSEGFNCAESVFFGVCQILGIEVPVSCVTGFGGGVARTGSVCGALLGAIAAVGVYVGRTDPADEKAKVKCYSLGQEVVQGFMDEMDTTICKEIIGFTLGAEGGTRQYAQARLKETKCKQAITVAIEAAVKAIKKDECQKLT